MTAPEALDTVNLSRCWQNNGWHAHGAGPCFDTREQAIRYRDAYDVAYTALMKWRKDFPWSHGECPEWYSFNNRWRS